LSPAARPGGNVTGFAQYEFAIGGKWLEFLKQFAPGHRLRAGALRARCETQPRSNTQSTRSRAPPVAPSSCAPSQIAAFNRERIIGLADKHRLPAVYGVGHYAAKGGLISYGIDNIDLWRRTASTIDRTLKGASAAELPVQQAPNSSL
jgi:ABC transporter substrate binding protein